MRAALTLILFVSAACGGGGGFPDAKSKDDAAVPLGTFHLSWSLTDANDAPIDCARVAAITVTATLRSASVSGGSTQVFTCNGGTGTSQGIAPGTYSIDYELDAGSGMISSLPRVQGIVIQSNQVTELSPLVFKVDATGNLALHLTANKAGGNCAPTTSAGADILNTTFVLQHTPGAACEPVTLTIAAGATHGASSYTVDCTTPVVGPCIENDQAITTTGTPSGSYQLHIRGLVTGGIACWANDDQVVIPAASGTLTRTLNLGYQMTTPGC